MGRSLQEDTHQWLVPIPPELVLSVEPGGVPIIHDVAPRVAMWTGETAAHLIGRPLAETFEEIIPGLAVVVEEVWQSGRLVSVNSAFVKMLGYSSAEEMYALPSSVMLFWNPHDSAEFVSRVDADGELRSA